jgi:hypothetical protein
MTGSFTWGRSIDGSSSEIIGATYGNSVSSLYFDRSLNKGPSDFNISRNLVINGLWLIPGSKGPSEALKLLSDGWKTSTIFVVQDGSPFTPLIAGDRLGLGNDSPYDVPSRVQCGNLTNPGNVKNYINLGCYTLPGQKRLLGNVTRNSVNAPGIQEWDFSLQKDTPIRSISENFTVEFRAEFFNLLNHSNFGMPSNSIYAATATSPTATLATAGNITSTNTSSRQTQFGLKLLF